MIRRIRNRVKQYSTGKFLSDLLLISPLIVPISVSKHAKPNYFHELELHSQPDTKEELKLRTNSRTDWKIIIEMGDSSVQE